MVDNSRITDDDINCSGLDECEFKELMYKYESIIDSKCEKFEFVTKVISDYERLREKVPNAIQLFVEKYWMLYNDDFISDAIESSILPSLIKVIVSNVLSNRRTINSIKTNCNL